MAASTGGDVVLVLGCGVLVVVAVVPRGAGGATR